jgi:hypothetical protein
VAVDSDVVDRVGRLADRLARLAQTSRELITAPNPRELLRVAARGTATIFQSPAAVYAETSAGARVYASCAGPGADADVHPRVGDLFDVPTGVMLRDEPAAAWPQVAMPGGGQVRIAGCRLRRERAPVYVAVPAAVCDPGAPVLTHLSRALAVSVDVLHAHQEEHALALTLQRSLLPTRLPEVDGYDLAVRYVPAGDQAEIGGDFYELCIVDGHLAVAVGDVAGHSLHAATVMAELRHATRAYLAEGHPPGTVLDRLNQLMLTLIPNEVATLCLLLVEPATGRARLANAGHPPPLLSCDGKVEYLRLGSALLGLRADRGPDQVVEIPAGGTLVLFTDGLVERRRAHIDVGLAALARAAAHVEADLDEFCDRLLAQVAPARPGDDIAVLALRRN